MDFLGIGATELLVIGLVAFLFLGPARMIEVARSFGKVVQEVRRTTSDLPSLMALDEPINQPPKNKSVETSQEPENDAVEEGTGER
jgi:Sec-independent protein translocase protein TatA